MQYFLACLAASTSTTVQLAFDHLNIVPFTCVSRAEPGDAAWRTVSRLRDSWWSAPMGRGTMAASSSARSVICEYGHPFPMLTAPAVAFVCLFLSTPA
jgi:hypothetical protein